MKAATTNSVNKLNEVLDPFFNDWAEQVIAWYERTKETYNQERNEMTAQFAHELGYSKAHSEAFRKLENKWLNQVGKGWFLAIKYDDRATVEKRVRKDMAIKKTQLINKVEEKVGLITEVNLHVGAAGTPNGRVVGDKGTVYVETIGAGGWNIQCFHYRVLVKPVRN